MFCITCQGAFYAGCTYGVASGFKCVAIVGASGSDKTTLAALLQCLYELTLGNISIGFSDLAKTEVHHLRKHMSVVSQNPHLFDVSAVQNITYNPWCISTAMAANVHNFIMSLPKGYDMLLGANATALISGGQAQRLQITRALARPSRILILDECTSALDPVNQAAVIETIHQAKRGRTMIMATHKLPSAGVD
ncbi:P-loop containing nucleoside triphosphate hydrolase protein [Fistulina hepatica ATCC 64428]|uniref:p-loop containing nucleoside triphosphate hydrolase protein n=1 Tax=Fistulina hepatica ATCC 64428 TaxID=1128425 RepID=A0A0D6ZZI7_9AGAR|nr:P-loop containing nucleoside triphosphate hydrolase protein [Fistulina hepatica ATCC 64428]